METYFRLRISTDSVSASLASGASLYNNIMEIGLFWRVAHVFQYSITHGPSARAFASKCVNSSSSFDLAASTRGREDFVIEAPSVSVQYK